VASRPGVAGPGAGGLGAVVRSVGVRGVVEGHDVTVP